MSRAFAYPDMAALYIKPKVVTRKNLTAISAALRPWRRPAGERAIQTCQASDDRCTAQDSATVSQSRKHD